MLQKVPGKIYKAGFKAKKVFALFLALLIICPVFSIAKVNAADDERYFLYVALDGTDSADGTINAPLATMAGARDKIRELKSRGISPEKGFVVYFREGEYPNNKGTVFTEHDSGTESAPIVYRSYPGETATFVGGVSIDGSKFKPISYTEKQRVIDKAAAEKIMKINLKELGFSDFGGVYLYGNYAYYFTEFEFPEGYEKPTCQAPEFYLDNIPLSVARYPNEGFLKVEEVLEYGWDVDGDYAYVKGPVAPGTPFKVKINGERMALYEQATQPVLYGFFRYEWADASVPVTYDKKTGVITSLWSARYGIEKDREAYFYNLLEEIDVPGEYYLEVTTGDLYIYPPEEMEGRTVRMSYVQDALIELQGASYLEFKDFGINTTRAQAIKATDSYHNVFSDLEISYTGEDAVIFNNGGYNTVKNSYFHDVNGGVVLNGDLPNLVDTYNKVINNHFENFARITKTYNGAISMYSVNDYAAYNEIHGADHLAIQFGGADNKIHYNNIYDVVNHSDDAGAIYGGQSWVSGRGLEIKYNYLHDIATNDGLRYGNGAVYLDGAQSEVTMAGNVVENVERAFWVNGGWDCVVYNNVVINSIAYFGTATMAYTSGAEQWEEQMRDPRYQTDEWKERYPLLVAMRNGSNWRYPMNDYYGNNVVVKGTSEGHMHKESENTLKRGKNFITEEDPGFYDFENKNYLLREDSIVFKKLPDFVAPPFTRMGTNYERAKERVKDAVVLVLGSPKSFKDGKETYVDETNHQVVPKLIGNYTYVPLRFIAEALGAEVDYDAATKKVSVATNTRRLELKIDSTEALLNGETYSMTNAAVIDNGRTLVPLREVANLLDKSVYWNEIGLIAVSDNPELFDEEKNSDDDIITYLFDQLDIY